MLSPRRISGVLLWMSTLAAIGRAVHIDDHISFGGGMPYVFFLAYLFWIGCGTDCLARIQDDKVYGVHGWHIQAEGHTPDIVGV
jgi:hypothetical protein